MRRMLGAKVSLPSACILSRLSLRSKPPVNRGLPVAASSSAASKASDACVPPLSEIWPSCRVKPSTFCLAFRRKACANRVWPSEASCSHTPPLSACTAPVCRQPCSPWAKLLLVRTELTVSGCHTRVSGTVGGV